MRACARVMNISSPRVGVEFLWHALLVIQPPSVAQHGSKARY
jgi:hypothetical protein